MPRNVPTSFGLWYDRQQRLEWAYHSSILGAELPTGTAHFLVYDQYTNKPVGRACRSLDLDSQLREEWSAAAGKRNQSRWWGRLARQGVYPADRRSPFFDPRVDGYEKLHVGHGRGEASNASLLPVVVPEYIEDTPTPAPRECVQWSTQKDMLVGKPTAGKSQTPSHV